MEKSIIFLKFLKSKLVKNYFPLHVILNITNRCNLKCAYCFGKFYDKNKAELNTNQILSLIDELEKMGTYRIGITGGEPLLRQDLPQIIRRIKDKNIRCGLNSNGVLIPDRINEIKFIDSICISLDGPQEIHNQYRGEGAWQAAIKAIETIKTHNIPLHIAAVLTKNNYIYIDYLFEKAKELKSFLQISPLYNQLDHVKDINFPEMLSKEEYKQAIKKILYYKAKGYPVFFSRKNYLNILNWPNFAQERIIGKIPNFKYIKCWAGKYMCSIEANGDVWPCSSYHGQKILNLTTHKFKEAFESVNKHDCQACLWACYNDFNALINLDISVLYEQFNKFLFEQK